MFLSDFAPYKPSFLPADNTENYSYFYDSMGRRSCFVAPERFYTDAAPNENAKLDPKVDIFSLGCVIAQLWMDGEALFDLAGLMSYRKGETADLREKLAQISDGNSRVPSDAHSHSCCGFSACEVIGHIDDQPRPR